MGSQTSTPAAEASYPTYSRGHAEEAYIQGYEPVSLLASHSSLNTTSLWLGFGLILASMAGFYMLITGLSANLLVERSTAYNPDVLTVAGGLLALACLVGGFGLVYFARRNYRAYVKRTGRRN
ncbi:hypothetical protein [Corynebacterium uterequi]|uniref:Uncharacterized protein n=1 Tax=Corynebacterium uterequi TaxID=1072256 RepID=A0A0G3HC31_9CORY|nr:hypothetical protein [Corynebacterium uterequi]AKK10245.1 hypothetical protein CUTER_01125 [Corynebacterium uterequi]